MKKHSFQIRSLALALVMVCSLFGPVRANAQEPSSQGESKYQEAVDVMAALGAIDSTTNLAVHITREEAAKLTVYSILGKDAAEKLPSSATGFSDVMADRWSAPFISYLAEKRFINGMGDGTFNPTANITGYQFAKMLLCAAGYGADAEFTGSGWELHVNKVAAQTGLFGGVAAETDHSKDLTREEAIFYAFNGLTVVSMADYSEATAQYVPISRPDGGDFTIASKVYATELVKVTIPKDGADATHWTYTSKSIGIYPTDRRNTLASSYDGTPLSALTNPTGERYIGYGPDLLVQYYYNGKTQSAAEIAEKIVPGVEVSFLDTDDDQQYDIVTVVKETLSRALFLYKESGSSLSRVMLMPGPSVPAEQAVFVNGAGINGGHVLWYQDAASGTYYLTNCDELTGAISSVNSDAGQLTIDGKSYYAVPLVDTTVADLMKTAQSAVGASSPSTVILNGAGYVIKVIPGKSTSSEGNVPLLAPGDTLFALEVGGDSGATVLFPNGTVQTVSLAVEGDVTANRFYSYVQRDNGAYSLTNISQQELLTPTVSAPLAVSDVKHVLRTDTVKPLQTFHAGATGSGSLGWKAQPDSVDVTAGLNTTLTYCDLAAAENTLVYRGIGNAVGYVADQPGSRIAYLSDGKGMAQWIVCIGGTVVERDDSDGGGGVLEPEHPHERPGDPGLYE